MTYRLDDDYISVPQDSNFGEGRDIDAPDWADVQGVAHWHAERRSSLNICFWDPSGLAVSNDSWQALTHDNGVGGDEDTAVFLAPDKDEHYHDDWQTGDYLVEVLVLMEVSSASSSTTLEVALDLAGFGTGSGEARQQTSTTRSPSVAPPEGGADLGWRSRHVMVRTGGGPVWGRPVANARNTEGGAVYGVAVRQVYAVHEATFGSDLLVWWPAHVTDPLVDNLVGETDPDDADLTLSTQAGDPRRVDGALNAGASSVDPIDAVTFDGEEALSDTQASWTPDGFVWCCAMRRADEQARVIWETWDTNGATIWKVRQTADEVVVEVTTADGTFDARGDHSGTASWEDWMAAWREGGALVLYYKGDEVDRTATTGSISAEGVTHAIGLPKSDTDEPWYGDAAIPALFNADADIIDRQRLLAWRRSMTGLGSVVDVS